jgi:hypothetical protein
MPHAISRPPLALAGSARRRRAAAKRLGAVRHPLLSSLSLSSSGTARARGPSVTCRCLVRILPRLRWARARARRGRRHATPPPVPAVTSTRRAGWHGAGGTYRAPARRRRQCCIATRGVRPRASWRTGAPRATEDQKKTRTLQPGNNNSYRPIDDES